MIAETRDDAAGEAFDLSLIHILLRFALEKARQLGATKMTLEVRLSNHGAQNLYRKLGFQDRGIRKGYYADTNEDAIIMWKDDLAPKTPQEDRVKWMM